MRKLSDTSPMPFGMHQGKPMRDIPCAYLHWLWCKGKRSNKVCAVADYIRRNLDALSKENEDAIW